LPLVEKKRRTEPSNDERALKLCFAIKKKNSRGGGEKSRQIPNDSFLPRPAALPREQKRKERAGAYPGALGRIVWHGPGGGQ